MTVSYEIFAGNRTPREARATALDRAKAEAVRRVIDTQVQATRQSTTIESEEEVIDRFSQIVRTKASGRVVDSEMLSEEWIERGSRLFYRLQLQATVRPSRGKKDPGFRISLDLEDADRTYVAREAAEDSDEIIARIRTTRDAYVTLFSVTTDTLHVIWPNALAEEHFVPGDTTIQFPSPSLRTRGLHLRTTLPPDTEGRTERLVAVATKQDIPFRPPPSFQIEDGKLAAARASLEAFNRWLVDIPLDQRATATVSYEVCAVEC